MSSHNQLTFSQPAKNEIITVDGQKVNRKWVNINIISRHLFCTICQDVFDDPKRISCGHTFCSLCISQWRQKSNSCPICRNSFSLNEVYRDLIAYNIINDQEVFCIHKGNLLFDFILGCPWKDILLNLNEHLKCCYFDSSKMPTYIKSFVDIDNIKEKAEDEDTVNSNNFLNFNSNIGLKARLYQKNKELMDKILAENSIKNSKQRDSLMDLLDKQDSDSH